MKFGFVTCVQLGLACMEEIYRAGGQLDLVVTLHDDLAKRKSGRIYVDEFCRRHRIHDVVKVHNVNEPAVLKRVRELEIDWLFIIGWSQIAERSLLQAPRRGVLGMHPTLLPVGRGRAAIPWAILKGLRQTGVTLFQLDEGVDTGPVIAQEAISIGQRETATSLYERLNKVHKSLIRRAWPDLVDDRVNPTSQDESEATYWPKRTPEDGRLVHSMTVEQVDRLVRAVTRPYPGAFIDMDGRRLRIWNGVPQASSDSRPEGAVCLSLNDGAYYATDYEWE